MELRGWDMEEAIKIYESLARPPKEALRTITGGKLNGKTDINPQWRYKAMTEKFGLVGIGWKYDIQKLWTERGAGNEMLAFAQVAVFVKDGDVWSEPIVGIGGSKLVGTEKGASVSNDEGYKMAVTDAFSTALKMLGVAADIYAGLWDGSKYKDTQQTQSKPSEPKEKPQLKGGDTTPEESARIKALCTAKYENKTPVFTQEEMKLYCGYRKDKFTAQELIKFLENALRNRNPNAKELKENETEDIC